MSYRLKHYLVTERGKELSALKDCFDLCLATNDHVINKDVRRLANESIRSGGGTEALDLYRKTLLFDAPNEFDAFIKNEESEESYLLEEAQKVFNNIEVRICHGKWVLISKKSSPNIHFVIRHPRLMQAIENFSAEIEEK